MKRILLVLAILALLAVPMTASAATGVTYSSGIQVQNLSSSATANISIDFYDQNGVTNTAWAVTDTINANSSKTYFPLSTLPDQFKGSGVVSSDQPVAAISNVLGNNAQRADSYAGFSTGGNTVNVPLLFKAAYGNDTWINVQNVGTGDASVTINYTGYVPGGSQNVTCSDGPYTIKVNASHTFDQAQTACLPTKFVGSAVISSPAQPVAAVVMEVGTTNLMAYAGVPTTDATTTPVMPLILANAYGNFTGVQIMNVGASSTDVTVTYTGGSTTCTEKQTVAASKSATFGYPMPASCGTAMFVGAGKVTANSASQPLVAIVNHIRNGYANASSYNAVNPTKATAKVSFPIIFDRIYGLFTGISVVNMGTQATSVTCNFSNSTHKVGPTTLQPGAAVLEVQNGLVQPNYVGSAVCTASGGDALIAGIADENKNATPDLDVQMTYPGINFQ